MPRIGRRMDDCSDLSGEVTVVDVYDIASDIGKECEKVSALDIIILHSRSNPFLISRYNYRD